MSPSSGHPAATPLPAQQLPETALDESEMDRRRAVLLPLSRPPSAAAMPATSPMSASSSAASAPPSTKLDAILYNLYSKSVALITSKRLTHWQDDEGSSGQNTPSGSVRINKWFGIALPDDGAFKEELRLWRTISDFVPPGALEASLETPAQEAFGAPGVSVPVMILDVLLDPAQLQSQRGLALVLQDSSSGSDNDSDGTTAQRFSATAAERQAAFCTLDLKPIVLERWRLDLAVFQPSSLPDLQAVYRSCTAHLQSVASSLEAMPAKQLYSRIVEARGNDHDVETQDSLTRFLQIGCRLGAGEPDDPDEEVEYRLRDPLRHTQRESSQSYAQEDLVNVGLHGFPPITCPIGSLNVSVEYRQDVSFAVQREDRAPARPQQRDASSSRDQTMIKSIQDAREMHSIALLAQTSSALISSADLRPDEDYFKPKPDAQADVPLSMPLRTTQQVSITPRRVSALAAVREMSSEAGGIPTMPFAGTVRPGSSSYDNSRPAGILSGTPNRLPGTTMSSKPVAGLSGFRHQGAFVGVGSADTPPLSSSPGAGEPAFLTAHSRRVSNGSSGSTTERRFRSLSTYGSGSGSGSLSGDKSSPPSPVMAAPSLSPGGGSPAVRPALQAHYRFGSYSPSSPSPLAQQLASATSVAGGQIASNRPSEMPASAGFALHTRSSSFTGFPGSGSSSLDHSNSRPLTLRSIFQKYVPKGSTPSHSGTGSLSGSRTSRQDTSLAHPGLQRASSNGSSSNDTSISQTGSALVSSDVTRAAGTEHPAPTPRPTVSPQMIQRYPRTPSYRHSRGHRPASSTDRDADHVHANSSGAKDVSAAPPGGDTSVGSFSRSWQARAEARQQAIMMMAAQRANSSSSPGFGSGGGTTASFLHRTGFNIGGSGGGSPVSLYSRTSPGSLLGRDSPCNIRARRASFGFTRRGSVDELVAMIESRPDLQNAAPAIRTHMSSESADPGQPAHSHRTQAAKTQQLASYDTMDSRPWVPTVSTSGTGSRILLSTSAMDDMLARMTQSVSRLTVQARPDVEHCITAREAAPPELGAQKSRSSHPVSLARRNSDVQYAAARSGEQKFSQILSPQVARNKRSNPSMEGGSGALAVKESGRGAVRSRFSSEDLPGDTALDAATSRTSVASPARRSSDTFVEDDEEPAGRLELHSDPVTPTVERAPYHRHAGGALASTSREDDANLWGGQLSPYISHVSNCESFPHSNQERNRTRSSSAHYRQPQRYIHTSTSYANPVISAHTTVQDVGSEEIGDAERLRSFGEELSSVRGRRGASSLSHHSLYPHHAYNLHHQHRQPHVAGGSAIHSTPVAGSYSGGSANASAYGGAWKSRRVPVRSGISSPGSVSGSPVGSPGAVGSTVGQASFRRNTPAFSASLAGPSTCANPTPEDRSVSRGSSPRPYQAAVNSVESEMNEAVLDATQEARFPRLLQTLRQQQIQERWWEYQSERECDF